MQIQINLLNDNDRAEHRTTARRVTKYAAQILFNDIPHQNVAERVGEKRVDATPFDAIKYEAALKMCRALCVYMVRPKCIWQMATKPGYFAYYTTYMDLFSIYSMARARVLYDANRSLPFLVPNQLLFFGNKCKAVWWHTQTTRGSFCGTTRKLVCVCIWCAVSKSYSCPWWRVVKNRLLYVQNFKIHSTSLEQYQRGCVCCDQTLNVATSAIDSIFHTVPTVYSSWNGETG